MNHNIINKLFDADTFAQLNAYVISPCAGENGVAGDGVITGYGAISERAAFAAVQDKSILKGSVGIAHARKISSCIDMAVKAGAPFILVINSAGARIGEGLDVLSGYGQIMKSLSAALGIIPVFAVINGQCTGAASVIASMADFVLMPRNGSYLAFSASDTLKSVSGKDCNKVGSAEARFAAGAVSCLEENTDACLDKVRALISLLPDNSAASAPETETEDDSSRAIDASGFGTFDEYDVKALISQIADCGNWIELYAAHAKSVVTGLAQFGGRTACIIANQPSERQGELDGAACEKTARVLAFCDRFSIPVITLTNTCGFAVSPEEEQKDLSSAAALLITSFANSEIPKINIITGKAYGSAYTAMNGRQTGADIVYAWNKADISVITPEAGALLLYDAEIKSAADPIQARAEAIQKYRGEYASPLHAAAKGLVDDIIVPAETRARIISALYLLQ